MTDLPHPTTHPLQPGERVALAGGAWHGVRVDYYLENISTPALWTFDESDHVVVAHLGGRIHAIRSQLDHAGRMNETPASGELYIIPARHAYRTEAVGGLVRYAEMHLDPQLVSAVQGNPAELRPLLGHYDPFLHQALLQLASWCARQDDLASLAASSLAHTLLYRLVDRCSTHMPPATASSHLRLTAREARQVEQYIAESLAEPIRLATLAALVRMTEHELLPAFRAAFGTTPAQYVLDRRISRARRLLLSTAKSVSAIAMETGFASHSHLTDTFRARVGCTPRQLRGGATGKGTI